MTRLTLSLLCALSLAAPALADTISTSTGATGATIATSRDLVAAMARGDRKALAGLVDLYGRGLRICCARALHRPHEAEDVMQEVFLRVWSMAARYDPAGAAVSTWAYRIAVNLCIDRNRRTTFRRFLGLGPADDAPEIADDTAGPDRSLAARQTLALVRAEIAALPDRQRQALLLRVVAEMDTATIAATMGTGTGAAEQLLVRARAAQHRAM